MIGTTGDRERRKTCQFANEITGTSLPNLPSNRLSKSRGGNLKILTRQLSAQTDPRGQQTILHSETNEGPLCAKLVPFTVN